MLNPYSPLRNKEDYNLSPIAWYLKDFDEDFFMTYHQHAYLEFMYAVEGSFLVEFLDTKATKVTETVEVGEGQMIFLDTEKMHKMRIPKGKTARIANIEFAFLDTYNSESSSFVKVNYAGFFRSLLRQLVTNQNGYVVVTDNSFLLSTLTRLIDFLANDAKRDATMLTIYVLDFLLNLKKSLDTVTEGDYAFIRKAVKFINDNLEKKLSIEMIARKVGKSPSYLAHKFKEDIGVPVLTYITNQRVEKACIGLKNTNKSIPAIAKDVGYKNKDQLNYQFHRVKNCTPSEYRKTVVHKDIDNRMMPVKPLKN